MINTLITAGITIVTSAITSFITWLLAKKKYNAEVDNNLIRNMQEALEFYKKLADDNKERLEELIKRNEQLEAKNEELGKRDDKLEEELKEMRRKLDMMMEKICYDLSCKIRQKDANRVQLEFGKSKN